MTNSDQFLLALTMYRENRSGGRSGMQSVGNVIMNRAAKRNLTPYQVCVQRLQFSSITAPGDPQLTNWPTFNDPQWIIAIGLAALAAEGQLTDITDGSVNYYAASMATPPDWAAEMVFTVEIQGQRFYKNA